jgi:undecaprenyl phosphate N,N'-diacetylbacillosamine 1-phosphate transferase
MALVLKRTLDYAISLCVLPFFVLALAGVALSQRSLRKDDLLYIQHRPGRSCRLFSLVKFKTMTDQATGDACHLSEENRYTGIGRFLRHFSLDELPQVVNVLRGDMSWVGPRPLRVSYLDYYTERQLLRQSVLPGVTGLAQIRYRSEVPLSQRIEADIQYVEEWSLLLDVSTLVRTLLAVVRPPKRTGILTDSEQLAQMDLERNDGADDGREDGESHV